MNSRGEKVDDELEKQNFTHAGKILAEIWSGTVIDGHPTVAEYIVPKEEDATQITKKSPEWCATVHVQESQYFLQIVKCTDKSCCSEPRSSYFSLIKDRFLPSPVPLSQTIDGLYMFLIG